MKVVLDTSYGQFWLPPRDTLWLLSQDGSDELFSYGPISESAFAERAVMSCINDNQKDFATYINDRWATWNWYMVDTERRFFLDYCTGLSIGHYRQNEALIRCAEKRQPDEISVVDIPDGIEFEIIQDTWLSEAIELKHNDLVKA